MFSATYMFYLNYEIQQVWIWEKPQLKPFVLWNKQKPFHPYQVLHIWRGNGLVQQYPNLNPDLYTITNQAHISEIKNLLEVYLSSLQGTGRIISLISINILFRSIFLPVLEMLNHKPHGFCQESQTWITVASTSYHSQGISEFSWSLILWTVQSPIT